MQEELRKSGAIPTHLGERASCDLLHFNRQDKRHWDCVLSGHIWCERPPPPHHHQIKDLFSTVKCCSNTPILFRPKQEEHRDFTETSSCKLCNRLKGRCGLSWKARVQSWLEVGTFRNVWPPKCFHPFVHPGLSSASSSARHRISELNGASEMLVQPSGFPSVNQS